MAKSELTTLSEAMAAAAEKAAAYTVLVDGRRRFPASGVAYAPDLILTADHVVERDEDLRVILPDGTELPAEVAGRDPGSDLALLRLEKGAAKPAERAAGATRPGQLALALGRPTSEGIQASLGIVSAVGGPVRTGRGGLLERYIRTDAIPYPGFSGGPLIDAEGRLLGINTSGLGRGASLAIPVELAWKVAASLQEHGTVKRGFLGVRSQPAEVSPKAQEALGRQQATGLLIVGVEDGSPAAEGGLMVGDILVGINGHPVEDHDELLGHLTGEVVGKATPLEVLRGGEPVSVEVKIGEREEPARRHPHPHHRRRGPWGRGPWRGPGGRRR